MNLLDKGTAGPALLAVAILWFTNAAGAGPRDPPPPWKDPSGPPTEMEVWLRRLVGRYRVDGIIEISDQPSQNSDLLDQVGQESIRGMVDCVAVGPGAGVQCVLNVAWLDVFQIVMPSTQPDALSRPVGIFNVPGGVSYLNPAMTLFGIDPGKAGMNYLLVDNKGLPEGEVGFNSGNRATFRTSCVNAPVLFNAMIPTMTYRSCDRIIRIDARPDASVVHLSMDIKINDVVRTRAEMTLRRDREAGAAPADRRR